MRRVLFSLLAMLVTFGLAAQQGSQTITLTVSGEGATKEEAVANALRGAIEQSFGVFVSSNTQILNDKLVRDEIATISSGNIKEYKELGSLRLSNGLYSVSLAATISIDNLISYAKSKGATTEFAGALFAMNMKMKELNRKNEPTALLNLFYHLQELAYDVFDWDLEVGHPVVAGEGRYEVPMKAIAKPNATFEAFCAVLKNTLSSLSLTPAEVAEYDKHKIARYDLLHGVVLRNDPEPFMKWLFYLISNIKTSFNVNGISTDGVKQYYEKNISIEYPRYSHYTYYKNSISNFLGLVPNSDVVFERNFSIVVPEGDFMTLAGFEIARATFDRVWFTDQITSSPTKMACAGDFQGCVVVGLPYGSSPKEVELLEGVTSIGEGAFWGCSSLTNIVIPEGVTSIGERAFFRCSSLTNIVIPEGVTSIGREAFSYCSSLTNIFIPEGVTSIGDFAFSSCLSLTNIFIPEGVTSIGMGVVIKCPSLKNIFVPSQSVEAYRQYLGRSVDWGGVVGYDLENSAEEIETFSEFAQDYIDNNLAAFKLKDEFETTAQFQQRVTVESIAAYRQKLTEEVEAKYINKYAQQCKMPQWYDLKYEAKNERFVLMGLLAGLEFCQYEVQVPSSLSESFKARFDSASKTINYCLKNDRLAIESISIIVDGREFIATRQQ